jgi:TatD DNase family protein
LPFTVRAIADHLGTDVSMLSAQLSSNTELVYGSWADHPVVAPGDPWAAQEVPGDPSQLGHDGDLGGELPMNYPGER